MVIHPSYVCVISYISFTVSPPVQDVAVTLEVTCPPHPQLTAYITLRYSCLRGHSQLKYRNSPPVICPLEAEQPLIPHWWLWFHLVFILANWVLMTLSIHEARSGSYMNSVDNQWASGKITKDSLWTAEISLRGAFVLFNDRNKVSDKVKPVIWFLAAV